MMRSLILFAVIAVASAMEGQVSNAIGFTTPDCIKAGELPLLQLNIDLEGDLRAYFRRVNTSDWCSVEGVNDGPLSRVVLPKFEAGDEIEYFFVVTEGLRVAARSPQIYRSRITADCELPFARHVQRLSLSCTDDPGGVATSMGAGYSLGVEPEQPCFSPDSPDCPEQ